MTPYLEDARQELKRVEHLLFVSLKYTRTVDVLMTVLDRIITCLDAIIIGLLEHAKEEGKVEDIPENMALRAELLTKTYDDEKLAEMVRFFQFLRRVRRTPHKKSNEYRRHVTMAVVFEEIVMNVTIDKIKEYYDATVAFLEHANKLITGGDDDD